MEEGQDLDRYFRKKLEDYNRNPPERVWQNISRKLQKQPESNFQARYALYPYIAVAATVTVLVISGLFIYKAITQVVPEVASVKKSGPHPVIKEKAAEHTSLKDDKKGPDSLQSPPAGSFTATRDKTGKKEKTVIVLAVDNKKVIVLPDSSTVYLNKNSRVEYMPDFSKRKVKLLYGEAYFEVRKSDNRRFSVTANRSLTEVYGTSFMVRSKPAEMEDRVFVNSGKVAVTSLRNTPGKMFLLPGEKCTVKEDGAGKVEKITDRNYHAWQDEEIVFKNTPLEVVVKTLEEYYGVSVEIKSPEILNCYFTGQFKKSGINEVLQVLAATFNLSFDDREGAYTLSGKGCR